MADKIDEIICSPDVIDIETFIEKMKSAGYIFTNEDRLIAKPQDKRYGYSFAKLGYGYSREMLLKRIMEKQIEINISVSDDYRELQIEAALCFREFQREIYRVDTPEIRLSTYAELKRNAELLTFISRKNIRSKEEFAKLVNESAEFENYVKDECEILKYRSAPQNEIEKKESALYHARQRKAEYARNYRVLLDVLETDYDRILKKEKLKKEMEEYSEKVKELPERNNPNDFMEQISRISYWSYKAHEKTEEIHRQREEQERNYYNSYGAR